MEDFSQLGRKRLERMATAGHEVRETVRALANTGDNPVSEMLHHQAPFAVWDHYPKGDVYDWKTHSQYYFHAHPPSESRFPEHGHFHTFLRPKGMPIGVKPAPVDGFAMPEDPNDALSHLVAISVDEDGQPLRLFTTNRWVTGEVWYNARDRDPDAPSVQYRPCTALMASEPLGDGDGSAVPPADRKSAT